MFVPFFSSRLLETLNQCLPAVAASRKKKRETCRCFYFKIAHHGIGMSKVQMNYLKVTQYFKGKMGKPLIDKRNLIKFLYKKKLQ